MLLVVVLLLCRVFFSFFILHTWVSECACVFKHFISFVFLRVYACFCQLVQQLAYEWSKWSKIVWKKVKKILLKNGQQQRKNPINSSAKPHFHTFSLYLVCAHLHWLRFRRPTASRNHIKSLDNFDCCRCAFVFVFFLGLISQKNNNNKRKRFKSQITNRQKVNRTAKQPVLLLWHIKTQKYKPLIKIKRHWEKKNGANYFKYIFFCLFA